MRGRVVFLLEEQSMHNALQGLLPRIFPGWQEYTHWVAVPHQGKSDLERSIPRKLKSWRAPGDRFVILRDNDGGDCMALKARLRELARHKPSEYVLIRIVMHHLETWFLGDFDALASGYPEHDLTTLRQRAKFREPERLTNASEEIEKLIPGYRKTAGATRIAPHLNLARNAAPSFGVFVDGLRTLTATMR